MSPVFSDLLAVSGYKTRTRLTKLTLVAIDVAMDSCSDSCGINGDQECQKDQTARPLDAPSAWHFRHFRPILVLKRSVHYPALSLSMLELEVDIHSSENRITFF